MIFLIKKHSFSHGDTLLSCNIYYKWVLLGFWFCFVGCFVGFVFCFILFIYFLRQFLCVAKSGLELTVWTRLALNS